MFRTFLSPAATSQRWKWNSLVPENTWQILIMAPTEQLLAITVNIMLNMLMMNFSMVMGTNHLTRVLEGRGALEKLKTSGNAFKYKFSN